MADLMTFPKTVDEFMEKYKIVDTEKVYTNGTELVPIFRMKQWFEHSEKHGRWIEDKNIYKCTACNDLLTVAGWADCIPEKQIYKAFKYCPNCGARMNLKEKKK